MTKKINEQLNKWRETEIPALLKIAFQKEQELTHLKRQLLSGKISNYQDINKIRKEIARVLTIVSEKAELQLKKD